jgi:hypothetical protein
MHGHSPILETAAVRVWVVHACGRPDAVFDYADELLNEALIRAS